MALLLNAMCDMEISQLYDLIISSNPAIAAFSLSSFTLGICFSFIAESFTLSYLKSV
jgi:hypothetical protein